MSIKLSNPQGHVQKPLNEADNLLLQDFIEKVANASNSLQVREASDDVYESMERLGRQFLNAAGILPAKGAEWEVADSLESEGLDKTDAKAVAEQVFALMETTAGSFSKFQMQ